MDSSLRTARDTDAEVKFLDATSLNAEGFPIKRRIALLLILLVAAAMTVATASAIAGNEKQPVGKDPVAAAKKMPADRGSKGQEAVGKDLQKTSEGAGPTAIAAPAKPPPGAGLPRESTAPPEKLPPVKGSHIADDADSRVQCHTMPDLWDPKDKDRYRLYIPMAGLKKDVHYQQGVNCSDCHGGDPESTDVLQAHSAENHFRSKLAEIMAVRWPCCHEDKFTDLRKSVHAEAGLAENSKLGGLLSCNQCHGQLVHRLLPPRDPNSPVYLASQVQTCGRCHGEHEKTFLASVHGQGLTKLGLNVGPVCADCHVRTGSTARWTSVRR